MVNNANALQAFWSSFGIPAYDEYSVPKNATLPYITYEYKDAGDALTPLALTASVFYRSNDYTAITSKVNAIKEYISSSGILVPTDKGHIWITRSSNFAQRMHEDANIARMILTINVQFNEDI